MKVVGIIQARTGSTRLPGKVLKPILGKPMLARMLERVVRAKRLNAVVVATTDKSEDDAVAYIARAAGAGVFRGSERDVLNRMYRAAQELGADAVVRLTGDCPLMDPKVIDEVVERFLEKKVGYTSTPQNYPEGLDCEVLSFVALERASQEAYLPSEREHVTQYIQKHPKLFVLDERWRVGPQDHSQMHWSVDTPEDLTFITAVFERLHKKNPDFDKDDVLALLAREPQLLAINSGGTGYEGLAKSQQEDEVWKRIKKLVLGTVELGMEYGIDGVPQPAKNESLAILDIAYAAGIDTFDTAAGYGSAEELLGHWMAERGLQDKVKIISKGLGRADVDASLKRLRLCTIDGYLLHRTGGSLEELQDAQRAGLVAHIGASVYDPEEVKESYEYVQVPYNVFDHRFEGVWNKMVFARSPFLQGLLLMAPAALPPHLAAARPHLEQFINLCKQYNLAQLQGALLFALAGPAQHVVFGVKTKGELEEILAAARMEPPAGFVDAVKQIHAASSDIVDPRLWNRTH